MPNDDGLFLHEEILLLALRDAKGTMASGVSYSFGMGGAILAELLMAERIRVVQPKKSPLAELQNSARMGNAVLNDCLDQVRNSKKRASLQTWVSKFANTKKLKHRVAEGLCRRGILRAEEDRILGLFTRKTYPERDPGPEQRIVSRLRRVIFSEVKEVDPRTVTLLSIAHHTGILRVVLDKKKLKTRKKRIEKIMNGDLTAKATQEAIQAMQTAVLVACILPAIYTSTIAHH